VTDAPFHQHLCLEVAASLRAECPPSVLISVRQPVVVDDRAEPRSDVVLVREEGADRSPVLAADVLLAVEVIAPESVVRDRHDKMALYASAGIPAYWLVDPLAERITFTELLLGDGGDYRPHVRTDGLVTIDRPWVTTLDLPAWTRRRERLRAAARPAT
jgi:Uma2 family endonuclease